MGGKVSIGQFSGFRYLNGQLISPEKYLTVMNSQGYVAQQDTFLESLTVWQTIFYSALLRTRGDISIDEKLKR